MKKKCLILALSALLLFSFVGCGADEEAASGSTSTSSTSSTTTSSTTTAQATDEVRSYDMFIRSQYHDWIEELNWYDVAEERTGIHVNYIDGPLEIADTYTEVDQRLASRTLPDATMLRLSQAKVYGAQGAFVDLAPYIKEYAPHIQAYIDEHPDYLAYAADEQGRIFAFVRENPQLIDFMGYRADHFEEAGIDIASVKTVDDLTNAMRTLKAYYGASNPNYYPLSGRESALRFAYLFGAAAYVDENASGGIYYAHEKDNCFNIKADGAYEWIQTMKTWYDEGLINPSWVEGTNTEGDWEAQTLQGDSSLFYDYYNRAEWFMSNGGPTIDPDYDMRVMDMLVDEDGNIIQATTNTLYGTDNAIAVNASCDEATIITICQFMDYFYTEEGIELANWGVEGESFQYNEDGSRSFIVDYTTEETKPAGEKRWSFLSDRLTVCKPVDQEAFYAWNTPLIAEAASRIVQDQNMLERPVIVYTTEEEQRLSNLIAAVYNNEVAGLTSFIVGNTELNEANWDAFIAQMDRLGLAEIEQIQLTAYRRTMGLD